jgi:hypothetical protein
VGQVEGDTGWMRHKTDAAAFQKREQVLVFK